MTLESLTAGLRHKRALVCLRKSEPSLGYANLPPLSSEFATTAKVYTTKQASQHVPSTINHQPKARAWTSEWHSVAGFATCRTTYLVCDARKIGLADLDTVLRTVLEQYRQELTLIGHDEDAGRRAGRAKQQQER
jgi:hypothetical protein